LPEARAAICVGLPYWLGHRAPAPQNAGRVARYAWGADYHAVMGDMLGTLAARLRAELGGEYRWYVDTGPLMDKALAARSGIGWYGRNTNLLTEDWGSFLFLGEILTTLDLAPDPPLQRDCGSCTLCVVACPTGALDGDYRIDSRRCISYLTIEHRGPIPRELRASMGNWVFGCDVCQDVCPPTMRPYLASQEERRAWAGQVRAELSGAPFSAPLRAQDDPEPHPLREPNRLLRQHADLIWLLRMTHAEYLEAFRGTAIRRAKDWMLRRNAAVALGNVGDERSFSPLLDAIKVDSHPVVRGHAAWALGKLAGRYPDLPVREGLAEALAAEADPDVREEIAAAMG
jgi:epoxyqueuosine reductase